jgi:hypothetical protein
VRVVTALVVSEKARSEGVLIPEKALYAGLMKILDGFGQRSLHCFINHIPKGGSSLHQTVLSCTRYFVNRNPSTMPMRNATEE